ncbi:MAG: phage/plasmid primase, P4 family [Candidatus Nanopelagicales bacterium]|nr:phage/plasmid primase, P4 family [Candidatus Nanopelagicales bacterium]
MNGTEVRPGWEAGATVDRVDAGSETQSSITAPVLTWASETFAARLGGMNANPKRDTSGPWWSARCVHPDHDDDTPSMRFRDGDTALIVTCHGCTPTTGEKPRWLAQVLAAAETGAPLPEANPSKHRASNGAPTGTRDTEYVYVDADRQPIARKVRYRDPKGFIWERPYGDTWTAGLGYAGSPADLPLYRLPELLESAPDAPVWLVEGEKDTDRVRGLGETATCSPNGSAGPPRDLSPLTARHVKIVLDRDRAGEKSARRWMEALHGVAATVTVLAPIPEHEHADISDHLDAGHGLADLIEIRLDVDKVRRVTEPEPTPNPPELTDGQHRTIPVGRKFAAEHLAGRWMFVPSLGWHRWDGTRWRPASEDRVLGEAATWLQTWLADLVRGGASADVIRYGLRYRDVGNVRQVVAAARTSEAVLVDADRLDQAPGLLNCSNGTIDLRTGRLRDHDPRDLITKATGVDYEPNATHPDWIKALAALDRDVARYLRQVVGAAASGEHERGDPVTFHHGHGRNGKSLLLGTILAAFGDYGVLVPDQLLAGRSDGHPTELMPLRGARFALLEELPEDHLLPVPRIKKLADTPVMTARLIGRDFVTWRPTHALHVSTNYHPVVSETDFGTWRRLAMIDYPRTFVGAGSDETLKRRLHSPDRLGAVLAWIVTGAREWYAAKMAPPVPPEAVKAATEAWREASDPLAQWLRERIRPTKNHDDRISTRDLHADYAQWQPGGSRPWSLRMFSGRLKSHRVITDGYLGVDRGGRNRERMALIGAVWVDSAQLAQGHPRGSREGDSLKDLWVDPAQAAHKRETGSNADGLGPCVSCGNRTKRYGNDASGHLCEACQMIGAER